MGERLINPIHNVFKQYRKMNLVNPYLFSKPFESTWRTTNTSTGSSTSTQVKLPLISAGTYSFMVTWGDGTSSTITSWNQAQTTHTYAVAGDYTIKINGTCVGWQFNNLGDRLKILSIQQWGALRLSNIGDGYFRGCANLRLTSVSDLLQLNGLTSLRLAFSGCTSLGVINKSNEWDLTTITNMNSTFEASNFNGLCSNWNVSNVTSWNSTFFNNPSFNQPIGSFDMRKATTIVSMLQNSTAFNQNLGAWNLENLTTATNFLGGKTPATFSTTNLNAIYNGWSTKTLKPNVIIGFGTAKYTVAGAAGRAILTNSPNFWTITDGGI